MSEIKFEKPENLAFYFAIENKEIIKITEEGKLFVHGKEVVEDIDLYYGFIEFLKAAEYYPKKELTIEKVPKNWGFEHWFANTEKYCGKLLFVEKGEWSSKGAYHYHMIKDETFFVLDDSLIVDYVTMGGEFKRIILNKYDSFRVPIGMKHRFTTETPSGCHFIEASTTHYDSDSYRVNWNEEDQKWVPV